MARVSSAGTRMFMQSASPLPAGVAFTAATKAAPSVATVEAITGISAGKIVVPKGTGWRSLDNKPFQATVVAALAVTLGDSDTAGETLAFVPGTLAPVTLIEFCMATVAVTSPEGAIIDVTTLCDTARETVQGLPAVSTWAATGFWDADDAAQDRLRAVYRSNGEKIVFAIVFNDGSGVTFMGTVGNFGLTAGVDQAVAISVGGTISGTLQMLDDAIPIVALEADPTLRGRAAAALAGQEEEGATRRRAGAHA